MDHFDRAPHQILRASCLCKAVKLSEAEKQGELSWRKVRCEDLAHILWKMAALKAWPRTFLSVVWLYLDRSIVCSWDSTVNLSDIASIAILCFFFLGMLWSRFFKPIPIINIPSSEAADTNSLNNLINQYYINSWIYSISNFSCIHTMSHTAVHTSVYITVYTVIYSDILYNILQYIENLNCLIACIFTKV